MSYKSGVFDAPCGTDLDHGVLAVGLTDNAYTVKNSWGISFGEKRYIRITRNIANKVMEWQ
jgi:C1A family cysteine protease